MISTQYISIEDNLIDFYLIGPGYGECIIVVIGNKVVIGIDCCVAIQQPYNSSSSLLDEIFSKIDGECYLYWVLTHYHSDHFLTFSDVLYDYGSKVNTIVTPPSYTIADIHYNLKNLSKLKEFIPSEGRESISSEQYDKLRKRLELDNIKRKTTRANGKGILIKEYLKSKKDMFSLEVNFYGPFDLEMDQLTTNQIIKLLGDEKNKKINRAIANKGSYIVHIRCGNIDALLLGDAPINRAVNILSDIIGNESAEKFILKVSHHGSKTGTSKKLLEELDLCCGEKYAFITPFSTNNLPDKFVLDLLVEHNYNIVISNNINKSDPDKILFEINFLTEGAIDTFIPTKQAIIHRQFGI